MEENELRLEILEIFGPCHQHLNQKHFLSHTKVHVTEIRDLKKFQFVDRGLYQERERDVTGLRHVTASFLCQCIRGSQYVFQILACSDENRQLRSTSIFSYAG